MSSASSRNLPPFTPAPDVFEAPRLALAQPLPVERSGVAWLALSGLALVILSAGVFAASAARPEWGPLVDRALSKAFRRGHSRHATGRIGSDCAASASSRGNRARSRPGARVLLENCATRSPCSSRFDPRTGSGVRPIACERTYSVN